VTGQTAVTLSAVITVALPILAAAVLAGRDKARLLPALLGAATFLVFQCLLRIPVLSILSGKSLSFILFTQTQPVLYALVLSLSAALVEEGGRYLVMRFLLRRREFYDGVAFGIGHGGVESIAMAGLPILAALIAKEEISGAMALISAAERVFTIVIHVAFSLMVMRSAAKRRVLGLIAAFVLHAALNFVALVLQVSGYPVYVIELFILGFMFFMLGYILYVRINATPHTEKEDAA
jgi:uncharacterized membrane protein YhfC